MKKAILAFFAICVISSTVFSDETNEYLQHVVIKEGNTSCDLGILYRETEEGLEVEVAGVATGKGADLRRWEISDIKLDVEGAYIRPVSNNFFYGERKSIFALPAAFVFAAIGTQYEMYGNNCSSGQLCHVTGHPERGAIATGIDKAGMTVGLGLLAAQAKGEIRGLKSVFKLNKDEAILFGKNSARIRFVLEDNSTSRKKKLSTSIVEPPL